MAQFKIDWLLCLWLSKALLATDIIVPPAGDKSGPDVGLLLFPDEEIPNQHYLGLSESLQSVTDYRLYVGIPEFVENEPTAFNFENKLVQMLQQLQSAGFNANTSTTFLAGHGKGGHLLQYWTGINANNYSDAIPFLYGGQILLSSFIDRIFRDNNTQLLNYTKYSIPTLTLGGELDGICRITRLIEQLYIQNGKQIETFSTSFVLHYPVIMVQGMNHIQFTDIQDLDQMPSRVLEHDLQPEISYEDAHKSVVSVMSAFMNISGSSNSNNYDFLLKLINASLPLFEPFINALKLEGFYHFERPCNCENNTCPSQWNCAGGSNWTNLHSQQVMCAFDELPNNGSNIQINNTDTFHPTWQTNPEVHYAWIVNNCSSPTQTNCRLDTLTVTQNMYNYQQEYVPLQDDGFHPVAAYEMRTKLNSRQRCYQHINYPGYVDEQWNRCSIINNDAVQYGLNNVANMPTLHRYLEHGLPLIAGDDTNGKWGPGWTFEPMNYSQICNEQTHRYEMSVRSQYLYTNTSCIWVYQVQCGVHYCNVLSPAKVMEWIYVDGLRFNLTLKYTYNKTDIYC